MLDIVTAPRARPETTIHFTPATYVSLAVLRATSAELQERAARELVENPVLEAAAPAGALEVGAGTRRARSDGGRRTGRDDRWPGPEASPAPRPGLADHLLEQLRLSDLSATDRALGACLIHDLDDDGYLGSPLDELAAVTACGASTAGLERVLARLQEFDPPGVAARTLPECLVIQLRQRGHRDDGVAVRLVREHLAAVRRRPASHLAAALGVPAADVVEAIGVIASLDPKPGRRFATDDARYVTPDVFIERVGADWAVTLNEDAVPRLRISRLYRAIVDDESAAPEARAYVEQRIEAARWLIRAIHRRQHTLYRLATTIVEHQRPFLEHGASRLRPLLQRDIAAALEVSESTVSRATTGKYAHTPHGTFELKYFCSGGLPAAGGAMSAEAVKARIRDLVARETVPVSDQAIADQLAATGIRIARRTVHAYREALRIPPAAERARRAMEDAIPTGG